MMPHRIPRPFSDLSDEEIVLLVIALLYHLIATAIVILELLICLFQRIFGWTDDPSNGPAPPPPPLARRPRDPWRPMRQVWPLPPNP